MRALGSTALRVSAIGLGLAAIGRPGYINLGRREDLGDDRAIDVMRRRAHSLLDAAAEIGIRYIDTARSYGHAEDFLASWLAARPAGAPGLIVGSKWGYTYMAGWQVEAKVHEVKDLSRATFRRQIAESRQRLGPWLRLYQIHSATLESGVLKDRAVLDDLAHLHASGIVIGLSVSGPGQADVIRAAMEVEIDGVRLFGVVQASWNVLEPSAGPALGEAHRAGLGIIVKESLANGRLTERSADPAVAPIRRIGQLVSPTDAPPVDALAIAAVLAQPWVDVVLSGAVTPDQLRSNARALELSLGPEHRAALATLAVPAGTYWADRAARPWT